MRKIVFVIISITVFACSDTSNSKKLSQKLKTTSELVQIISSDSMQGRYPGTIGFEKAVDFVENYMKILEIKPFINGSYRDTLSVFDAKSYNLVGVLESKEPVNDYILLGAHLDHLGAHLDPAKKAEEQSDTIYNGANDNASGVVVILQIAKELKKYKFDKNIIIAFFTGEEYGKWGSEHLAKRLNKNNIKLSYVLNFDMVGVPQTHTPKSVGMTGFYISDFEEVSNKLLNEEFVNHPNDATDHLAFFRSDNSSFYTEYKIPSHNISTYEGRDQYPFYHDVQDEFSKLNIQHMDTIIAKTTKLIIRLLETNSIITLKKLDEESTDLMKYFKPPN
jgi:Zn-dependent M28 family amino/carboxypeptidase